MRTWKKKKDQIQKGTNEIENKELKEQIGDMALSLLQEGIDYEELAYTKIEFGYLFDFEKHGIESLFKVITDKRTIYMAVQGIKMLRLEFSEELFQDTIHTFLKLHN
ncbi:MAG: hypothetical protein HFF01_03695 [Erysipelotrichaceae bacterium]|nr:hypothetical protein [Erysipelotrichaceae bacterium]